MEDDNESTRVQTLYEIEALVLSFLKQLKECNDLSADRRSVEFNLVDRKRHNGTEQPVKRSIRLPAQGKSIAQLWKVLAAIYEAVATDIPVTKRDIYYADVPLFQNQATVDRLVDDIAATLELSRAELNVRASSKGLFLGSGLRMKLVHGHEICGDNSEATLIPQGEDIVNFIVEDDVAWVLVVEKEAVFQTLSKLRFADARREVLGKGIVITGKGYPDVATRQLIATLSENLPSSIPLVALVDGDPFGLDILSVYKFGSMSMQHERARLVADRIEWLGVMSDDLDGYDIDEDALIPLSEYDKKKALAMLERTGENVLPELWRHEIERMLERGTKAEIEIISSIRTRSSSEAEDACSPVQNQHAREDFRIKSDIFVHPLDDYLTRKILAAMENLKSCAEDDEHLDSTELDDDVDLTLTL